MDEYASLHKIEFELCGGNLPEKYKAFVRRVLNDRNLIPAADVAPVVRCKDCKHFNHKRMECENEAISTDHEGGAQYSLNFWSDDFCSYGERKDGADNDTDGSI